MASERLLRGEGLGSSEVIALKRRLLTDPGARDFLTAERKRELSARVIASVGQALPADGEASIDRVTADYGRQIENIAASPDSAWPSTTILAVDVAAQLRQYDEPQGAAAPEEQA